VFEREAGDQLKSGVGSENEPFEGAPLEVAPIEGARFQDADPEDARFDGVAGGDRDRVGRMGSAVWAEIRVPVVEPDRWPVHDLQMGLRELERLRRETEAAMALLMGALPESRDMVAEIARNVGVSNREARRRKTVANVCAKVKGALEKLQSGAISNEHVSALAPIADMPGAAGLLDGAASKSPEEFSREVEEFRLSSTCGNDMVKRQRARRSIRFFVGPEGMIGINGLLPPVEGTVLKNRLAAIVDAKWRSDHPDRGKTHGGHGGDTRDQRMADALLSMAGVHSWNSEETQPSKSRQSAKAGHGSNAKSSSDAGAKETTPPASSTGRGSNPRNAVTAKSSSEESQGALLPAGVSEVPHGIPMGAGEQGLEGSLTDLNPDKQNLPQGALSLNVGLRLVGLDGGLSRNRSVGAPRQGSSPPNFLRSEVPTIVKTGKPAVVIVFDVDRWKARIAGGGPIPITESLLDQARNDLYYCFKDMTGEVIKFGRSRRDPTPMQRLVLVVRDEKCLYPGCHAPPDVCDAHHLNEVVKDEGPTDTDLMGLFCEAHHRHIHLNDLVVKRLLDGSLTITQRRTGVIVASSNNKRAA
jgi:hypothetical protein